MKPFKISCHAISDIMAGSVGLTDAQRAELTKLQTRKRDAEAKVPGVKPLTEIMEKDLQLLLEKQANPELPAGAKTYVKKWLKRKLFNRKEDWKAIVVEKGLMVEQDSISLLGRLLGIEVEKNDEFFDEHEFIHGSPDVITHDTVRDIKSSWDLFTFPMFDDKLPKQEYWWQLQGYMILTGLRKASLDYVLIDTPMPLIILDLKKLYFQSGGKAEDWTPDSYQALYPNYQFNDIDDKYKLRSFEVEYAVSAEQQIVERVKLCREYIKEITPVELLEA